MQITDADLARWMAQYLWPFVRIGGLLLIAPVLGSRSVPARIRITLAVLLTLVLAPLLAPPPALVAYSAAWWFEIARQLLIGIAMGFVMMLVFEAVAFAGELIAYGMGLSFAQLNDPLHGASTPVVGQLLTVFATLLFLSLDGHLRLIEGMAESFQLMPIGTAGLSPEAFKGLALWGGSVFDSGLRLGLPLVIALLLVNLAFGLMGRAAPTLGGLAIGFPIALAAGFVLLSAGLPVFLDACRALFEHGYGQMLQLMEGAGG